MLIVPQPPEFLSPDLANAMLPLCYKIFYEFSIIISPEGLVCVVGLGAVLLLLLVSSALRCQDGA